MKTKPDFLKEIVAAALPRTQGGPKLELTLWEVNVLHKELVRSWLQARRASEAAYAAYREASQATQKAYAALAGFESELMHFQEKHNLQGAEAFQLVTKDEDTTEDDAG
jgi:hypothetical protein